jgi:putative membrane protein
MALVGGIAMTAGAGLPAYAATAGKASSHDKMFLTKAMQGDMAEIQMGKLAEQKGNDQQVKQFGQTLVSDHTNNLDKAKQLANTMGVTPPTQPSTKQQNEYAKVSKLSGTAFDSAFARDMVRDHKMTIAEFKKEAKMNGPVKQFAQESIPTLESHLKMAQSIESHKTAKGHM